MKTLALLFALSLVILPNPTHCRRNNNNNNPIRLPTAAHGALAASYTPVLDTEGAEVQAGGLYTMLNNNSALDVVLGVRLVGGEKKCPTHVYLSNDSSADPIIITPADTDATLVLESTFLTFKFNNSMPKCENKESWMIQYHPKIGQHVVNTGDIVRHLFKIERSYEFPSYKITYCPFDICYNISTYRYDFEIVPKRLVLSQNPYHFLQVVFQKLTPPVLDTDGHQLLPGGVYNIISLDEPEGEVELVKLDNTSDVIIRQNHNSGEDRIMFTPRFPYPFIWESTYLSIKFSPLKPTTLSQNNVSWEIQTDTKSGEEIVKTGDIVRHLFKIEHLPSDSPLYKITYCPTTTLCYNVNTYNDPSVNATRLALSDHNFVPVVFKKATN